MNAEKPLHVQVAEALGWTELREVAYGSYPGNFQWVGRPPNLPPDADSNQIPVRHYDTNWEWGGPLIERYEITVYPVRFPDPRTGIRGWAASATWYDNNGSGGVDEGGDSALGAVCGCILALHAAGKLR